MFDLRYHVASLAAVFLALIIGIVVGVGISSGGFVKKGERKLLTDQIADLRNRLSAANARAQDINEAQKAGQTFVQDTYPALMAGRLRGTRIALVFVGSIDGGTRSLIERTLSDAGASALIRIRALKVPIELGHLDAVLAARPGLAQLAIATGAGAIGRELGQEFVRGGQTPLWSALSSQLVAERLGGQQEPAEAVVVVRSAEPQQGDTLQVSTRASPRRECPPSAPRRPPPCRPRSTRSPTRNCRPSTTSRPHPAGSPLPRCLPARAPGTTG